MPLQSNARFLRAIAREPTDCTPIWIMRQAGRYLPQYRATRARAGSFMTLCKTPELAAEVTLQPLQCYALDAAIIFSDILTIPDAMGLGLQVIESKGPVFSHPVQDEKSILHLTLPDPAKLAYVYDAIKLVQRELAGRIPLIGFCGSPWTLAAYMVEGKSMPGFPLIHEMKEKTPALLHQLLSLLAKAVTQHLLGQIQAGVQTVMLFDTWGGLLNTQDYEAFSLYYLREIVQALNQSVPVILFTKKGGQWLSQMADTGCDVIGIDWETSLTDARKIVGTRVALQGNMDPAILLSDPSTIRKEVARLLAAYGHGSGHIFNLGHGITPDVPPEHVQVLVDTVHELSLPYH